MQQSCWTMISLTSLLTLLLQALLYGDLDFGVNAIDGILCIHLYQERPNESIFVSQVCSETHFNDLVLLSVIVDDRHRSFGECT